MNSSSSPGLEELLGTRFTLLDSVRDRSFLGAPGSASTDFGLGVLDNPLFFFTSFYEPGNLNTPRQYPVKLFWLGSPQGTNDANDAFSIYTADVQPENFAPGVVPGGASSWLVNPRLVLGQAQAKSDVVGWFDANYPGGASGGVGGSNSGSNSSYGALAGGSSAVGSVAGFGSIDGQFWPIYDYVDDSVLLYFSFKTPNCNSLSTYCYKLADTEFAAPATSAEFLGGLYAAGWTTPVPFFTQNASVLSSHRFSILSPDPLAVQPRTSGHQNAVFMYSYGVIDGTTADHGRMVNGTVVVDIHVNPLSPGIVVQNGSTLQSAGAEEYYTPDKLGSLFAATAVDAPMPGYVCIYNTPMEIDRRYAVVPPPAGLTSDGIYISAMQLRAMFYDPESGIGFGSDPIRMTQTPQALGTCRPQFTDLPDGRTKILYANYSWDNFLDLAYEYQATSSLSPRSQRRIQFNLGGNFNLYKIYTYGKKRLRVRATFWAAKRGLFPTNNLSANPNVLQIVGAANADLSNGAPFGIPAYIGSKYIHLTRALGATTLYASPAPATEFTVEDLDPYVFVTQLGPGSPLVVGMTVEDDATA